ncbi:hypothetical protein J4460_07185 [Candidatus Woesearchaeota archaeon]|nr:hypothetical protein [Candidatus Woesearchaeota archaeon]HIH38366.1 hypothetical protein [Candidatus Woesearchaeota archaeon]HIH49462.1 hypothetical protein [Candidatus Woesearchaeota archaeon]HIJ04243.1 hypothetical protein [Candidatus Woesearchaeota archaeon]
MVVMYVAHSHNGPAILNHLPSVEAIDQQVTDVDVLCYLLRHTQMFEQRAGTNDETGKSYLQLLENRRQYCASIAGRLPESALLRLHEKTEFQTMLGQGISRERLFELEAPWFYDLIPDPAQDAFGHAHEMAVQRELDYIRELAGEQPTSIPPEYLLVAHPMMMASPVVLRDRIRRLFSKGLLDTLLVQHGVDYFEAIGCDYPINPRGIITLLLPPYLAQ